MSLPIGTKIPLFAEGNATEQTVMEGITFSSEKGNGLKGKIKNRGKINFPCSDIDQINNNDGYYSQINVQGLNSMSETDIERIIKNTLNNNGNIRTTLTEKIVNDISIINPKIVGKKFASGRTTLTYPYNLRVSNLNFKPSIVLIETSRGSTNVTYRCIKSPIMEFERPFSLVYSKYKSTDGLLEIIENGFVCTNLFDLSVSKRDVPCDWIAIE